MRSFKESREWRLLLLEFVAYAARNPTFAERFKDHNGLAVEELSDPGSVSDELLSDVLALLVSQRGPALEAP